MRGVSRRDATTGDPLAAWEEKKRADRGAGLPEPVKGAVLTDRGGTRTLEHASRFAITIWSTSMPRRGLFLTRSTGNSTRFPKSWRTSRRRSLRRWWSRS